MKRHLVWFRSTAVAAVAAVGMGATPASAQYLPMYGATPQTPPTQQVAQQSTPVYPAYPVTRQPGISPQTAYPVAAQPVPTAPPVYTAYRPKAPTTPITTTTTATQPYPQTGSQYSSFPTYGYTTIAQQPSTPTPALPPQTGESLPAPAAATAAASVPASNGSAATPALENQGVQPGSSTSASGYPSTGYYQGDNYGCNSQGYDLSGSFDNCNGNVWFGGVYYLFMTRDNPDYKHFTSQFDTPQGGYPYYPRADVTVLGTPNVDHDYRPGFEIRFGSTLSTSSWSDDDCQGSGYGYGCGNSCQGYGNSCGCCAPPDFAWEFGYWYLDDDLNSAQVIDAIPTDTYRMYGMNNFSGLEYNGRPVNDYYDYQVPVTDPNAAGATDVRLLAQRVRSSFSAQNIELNLLRLPLLGASACNTGCGGYGAGACAPACASPFSVTGLCGFRYVRVDDDFEYATMWATDNGGTLTPPAYTPWDGANELFYDVQVDNHLAGFQLGANMNYAVSCRCNLFWNSSYGLYNNYISANQRVYGELGPATWVGSGDDAVLSTNKDDVAFVGEWRIGGAYDFTCNWRAVLAYRALAISGVALSVDQIPQDFSNSQQTGLIDSDGSIIIHGVQAGVECRY